MKTRKKTKNPTPKIARTPRKEISKISLTNKRYTTFGREVKKKTKTQNTTFKNHRDYYYRFFVPTRPTYRFFFSFFPPYTMRAYFSIFFFFFSSRPMAIILVFRSRSYGVRRDDVRRACACVCTPENRYRARTHARPASGVTVPAATRNVILLCILYLSGGRQTDKYMYFIYLHEYFPGRTILLYVMIYDTFLPPPPPPPSILCVLINISYPLNSKIDVFQKREIFFFFLLDSEIYYTPVCVCVFDNFL